MASVMNTFFIDKIDNIRAEFPLLEANLPSYSFISMDSIMSMCPIGLYNFDPVTDTEFFKIISFMNKTTCSSDPFSRGLLSISGKCLTLLHYCIFELFIFECEFSCLVMSCIYTSGLNIQ